MTLISTDQQLSHSSSKRCLLRSTPAPPCQSASAVLTLNGASPAGHVEAVFERLTYFYGLIFEKMGREPVPPLTVADLALAGARVFEGFAFRYNIDPEELAVEYDWAPAVQPQETSGGWTLLAITLEALLLRMTRPTVPG